MVEPTDFFIDLVRAETRLYNLVDARVRAAHGGLSVGQVELLGIIRETPSCRVADIVDAVDITVGAASKAVDRLEAAGLCERHANPSDRRSSVLELTPAGEAAHDAGSPTLAEAVGDLTRDVVPAEDLAQAARTLAALRAALEQVARA
ncbi:MAG: MarR family transcriptional regulator [Promicromonosporaceae bacterium]|nr:MarR family transcriptional regulator [Promicromonosporaceae bacterium]